MPSATYQKFRDAMLAGKQIHCEYQGRQRELCPVVLGHSDGEEKVLAYQVGGSSSRRLPAGGAWKCLQISQVHAAHLRDGAWREGESHSQTQSCVQNVDIDINVHVRKRR